MKERSGGKFYNSKKIIELLKVKIKKLTIIEDGDHSLSRETILNILYKNIEELSQQFNS